MTNELRDTVTQFVNSILNEKIEKSGKSINISGDLNFIQSGLMDSVGFLDLLGTVEDNFDIELDLSESDPEEFLVFDGFVNAVVAALIN